METDYYGQGGRCGLLMNLVIRVIEKVAVAADGGGWGLSRPLT